MRGNLRPSPPTPSHALSFRCAWMQECQFEIVIDRQLAGTMDIGLFKDEGTVAAPHRGPRIEVPSLKENLADTVELDQVANLAAPKHVDPTSASSSHATCRAPNS